MDLLDPTLPSVSKSTSRPLCIGNFAEYAVVSLKKALIGLLNYQDIQVAPAGRFSSAKLPQKQRLLESLVPPKLSLGCEPSSARFSAGTILHSVSRIVLSPQPLCQISNITFSNIYLDNYACHRFALIASANRANSCGVNVSPRRPRSMAA